MTQGHFILCGIQLVCIQNFPSGLVALPRIENPVCATIYPYLGDGNKRWIHAFS